MDIDPLDIHEIKMSPLTPAKEQMALLRPWMFVVGLILGIVGSLGILGIVYTFIEAIKYNRFIWNHGSIIRKCSELIALISSTSTLIVGAWSAYCHIKYANFLERFTQTELEEDFEELAKYSLSTWKSVALLLFFISLFSLAILLLEFYLHYKRYS